MEIVTGTLAMLRRWGQMLGPYLMLEILLPGGTLMALLLFLYRRTQQSECRIRILPNDYPDKAGQGIRRRRSPLILPPPCIASLRQDGDGSAG
jgi:hypothetical protein